MFSRLSSDASTSTRKRWASGVKPLTLENYAALLRKTGHSGEATMMELRAKTIRAKHARQNPAK
jgi:hypothetical protein